MADLLEKETFERLLKSNIEYKQAYFKGMFNETCPSFDDIFEEYYAAGQRLKRICNRHIKNLRRCICSR
ncbi:hypothetical protein ACVQ90_04175 [Staphylococcus aureus]